MGKEPGAFAREARKPGLRPTRMAVQLFEFPHGPAGQCTIDMLRHSTEGRGVEATVVVHPATDHRAKHAREVVNRFVALQL